MLSRGNSFQQKTILFFTNRNFLRGGGIMESVVGIFKSVTSAEHAAEELRESGVSEQSMTLLSNQAPTRGNVRQATENEVQHVPTQEVKNEGSGKEAGANLGAWIGGSAGFAAGATAATLMVPGLGAIFAIGAGAAALLGLGGAAVGTKIGDIGEKEASAGIESKDVEFYRELLRQGRTVLVVNAETPELGARAREVLRRHGGEDQETVRHQLRPAA
jgi:hypothetical protein